MPPTALVIKKHNEVDIPLRPTDRYVNATAMCKAWGKRWIHYWQTERAQAFISAIALKDGIPSFRLIESRRGRRGGTYVHPRIALDLAQWLSPQFAVQVNAWLEELLTRGTVTIPGHPAQGQAQLPRPWWTRVTARWKEHWRYINGKHPGYWSVITATMDIILATEDILLQHCLPLKQTDKPDGSIGKRWANHRKEQGLLPPEHTAPLWIGGKMPWVNPLIYPPDERGNFDTWLFQVYLPEHLNDYLQNGADHPRVFRSQGDGGTAGGPQV